MLARVAFQDLAQALDEQEQAEMEENDQGTIVTYV